MQDSRIPISQTKIILPKRRAELLSRQRLLDQLYEVLDRKLILISAPAGYGKTSLLIDLAHHSDLPFCWLTLDVLDREPQRFVAYFVAALNMRFPQFGRRSASVVDALTSLEDGMERLLVTLVNEIYDAIHEHFVLVVDDFHLVDDVPPIQYFVNRFVQLVGENCHLVLSSRSLPRLADLALLVARGQVSGLDFSDLAFRADEIQALWMQNRQCHLSDEEAARLAELSEGWVTGLQFSDPKQVRSGGATFPASHGVGVSMFDYLGQQVLEHQPDWLRAFLLRTSLLEEFDAALCESVLGPLYPAPQDWPVMIETLLQKNLFALPVGAEGRWVRYHHLFRDFLQERMRRERPEEIAPILQRLARLHEERGEWERAYHLRKSLGDVEALADLIERAGIRMYQNAMLTLDSWLKDLPPSFAQKRAGLLSLQGAVAHLKGNAAEAVKLLDRAVQMFRESEDLSGLSLALIRRGHAHRFNGQYRMAIQDAQEAMQITDGRDDLQWVYAEALRIKGLSLFRQGHTLQAASYLERALEIFYRLGIAHSIPILLMEVGMVNTSTGKYEEAKLSYLKALEAFRQSGNLSWQANVLNNLGFLHHQMGEYERAVQVLEEGLLCAQRSGYKRMEAMISIGLGDVYAELEDFEIANQNYLRARALVQQLDERFLVNYLALAETGLALLKEDRAEARRILRQIGPSVRASNSNYEYGLYYLLRGRLKLEEGKHPAAIKDLQMAKQHLAEDGREMESIWSCIWLAAAYGAKGEFDMAQAELRPLLQRHAQIKHFTTIAARQARPRLEGLANSHAGEVFLSSLLEGIERFDQRLPRLRRQVRRLAHTVEVPPARLLIRAFGPAQVWINGKVVSAAEWQTQSVRELFFYLLATAERPATREQIGEVLWPETHEPARLRLRFKNEMYRLRRAVGQEAIIFENDRYRFNLAMEHEYDVEAFQGYLASAKAARTAQEQIELYQKAVHLVRGPYLEDIGATWAWPERERLSRLFLSACLTLAELCFAEEQTPEALGALQRALEYDAAFEAAYRLMMRIYHRLGNRASVVHTYQKCEEAMQRMFALPPSEETRDLYHELTS